MKIILFGTGDYYRKYIKWFCSEDIIFIIDNNINKQGLILDGHEVLSPRDCLNFDFDVIVILSIHEPEMRKQLLEFGIEDKKIISCSDLIKHRNLIKKAMPVNVIISEVEIQDVINKDYSNNKILLISSTLDFSGATLALYYLAKVLQKEKKEIVFASISDGPLKNTLSSEGISVIIDPNLQFCTAKEIEWTRWFDYIVCNTMNFYFFLSDKFDDTKYVWWLHDPVLLYENLDKKLFFNISTDNLIICAAGEIAEKAIKKYMGKIYVHQLLYGIPQVEIIPNIHRNNIIEAAIIANVQDYKGQDILVSAIEELTQEERNGFHIRIVGNNDSAYAAKVQRMAKNLNGVIEFTGTVGRREIGIILNEIDVLICTSRVDTMSISCGEAMQLSIPCIVSDTVGIANYIKDGYNGIIFKCGDAIELSNKLRWCSMNRDDLSRIGKKGKEIYETYFSMDVFRRNVLELEKNIINRGHIERI